jgi:hypothetical protein
MQIDERKRRRLHSKRNIVILNRTSHVIRTLHMSLCFERYARQERRNLLAINVHACIFVLFSFLLLILVTISVTYLDDILGSQTVSTVDPYMGTWGPWTAFDRVHWDSPEYRTYVQVYVGSS